MRTYFYICLLLMSIPWQFASADEQSSEAASEVAETESTSTTTDADSATEPVKEDKWKAPSRGVFVPTENISEDSGITYPVDI